jgi:octaprenyl-diphosphate synthase
LGRYGRHTGVAWHLAEDIAFLDVNAGEDPATIEERAMEGRPSFVVSLAAARDPAVGQLWRLLGHDPQPEQALDLAQRLRAAGAFAEGRARVAQESWAAQQALAILEPSAPRDALRAIAAGLARGGKAGDQGQL